MFIRYTDCSGRIAPGYYVMCAHRLDSDIRKLTALFTLNIVTISTFVFVFLSCLKCPMMLNKCNKRHKLCDLMICVLLPAMWLHALKHTLLIHDLQEQTLGFYTIYNATMFQQAGWRSSLRTVHVVEQCFSLPVLTLPQSCTFWCFSLLLTHTIGFNDNPELGDLRKGKDWTQHHHWILQDHDQEILL